MDMRTSTSMAMSMGSTTATATGISASASATSTMSMIMGGTCQISMLWNWYTIDACFIASSWHVRSSGQFAGSCIRVILLVMSLEFLRRASREYDRYITLQVQSKQQQLESTNPSPGGSPRKDIAPVVVGIVPGKGNFRPNLFQQVIRALFHMVQFTVAYFIMLLAMYYNGYTIICIIIGAFVFSWEPITLGANAKKRQPCAVVEATCVVFYNCDRLQV